MRIVILTNRGIEQQCAQQTEEITGEKTEARERLALRPAPPM